MIYLEINIKILHLKLIWAQISISSVSTLMFFLTPSGWQRHFQPPCSWYAAARDSLSSSPLFLFFITEISLHVQVQLSDNAASFEQAQVFKSGLESKRKNQPKTLPLLSDSTFFPLFTAATLSFPSAVRAQSEEVAARLPPPSLNINAYVCFCCWSPVNSRFSLRFSGRVMQASWS